MRKLIQRKLAFNFKEFKKTALEKIEMREKIFSSTKEDLEKNLDKSQKEFVDKLFETYYVNIPARKMELFNDYVVKRKILESEKIPFDYFTIEKEDLKEEFNPIDRFLDNEKKFLEEQKNFFSDLDLNKLSQNNNGEDNLEKEKEEVIDPKVF